MFEISEVSAAPHFPDPLKTALLSARPESIAVLLAMAAENDNVEITLRNGEIFIELATS